MWIPVFTETTEPDTLGKQRRKRASCREKKPKFAKLRLVYKVQRYLGTQISAEKNFLFRQTLLVAYGKCFWKSTRPRYKSTRLGRADERKFFALSMERVSIECRKTKTKVITLANQKGRRQSRKPIKTRSNYT